MKVSEYIADFVHRQGVGHVFTVSGAGDLHMLDAIRRHPSLDYFCNHHEQASGMAAYSYSCVTRNLGVVLVTTGPGGTNTITGICSAWVDSVPVLVLSGQVKRADMIGQTGVRQHGIQEINIVDIVRPFTKYSVVVMDPHEIRFHLEKAVHLAKSGRPGPVWLDVPMDVQTAQVEPSTLIGFTVPAEVSRDEQRATLCAQCRTIKTWLQQAQRPVLLAGYGITAAGAQQQFRQLLDRLNIPVLVTWHGIDLVGSDHPLYVGRAGIYGQRGANFAIQNCDLLLSIGSRLSIPQVGYNYAEFARAAKKIYVDIDPAELHKFSIAPDLSICSDAGVFLDVLLEETAAYRSSEISVWRNRCQKWRDQFPVALPEYHQQPTAVNSFTFVDVLSDELSADELIIPGASGTAFTCTHQALRTKQGQTCFTSNGFAEMGFDLPGAIGACVAAGGKRTILITGDGSIQMNLQELQTIIHHRLPIKLFVLNNCGYLTIRQTQTGLFDGKLAGSSLDTGVSFPDMQQIGRVYGFAMFRVNKHAQLREVVHDALAAPGPVICEVVMDPQQLLIPKTSFKQFPDGRLVSPPIEDLYPFLPRDEFNANMIIPSIPLS